MADRQNRESAERQRVGQDGTYRVSSNSGGEASTSRLPPQGASGSSSAISPSLKYWKPMCYHCHNHNLKKPHEPKRMCTWKIGSKTCAECLGRNLSLCCPGGRVPNLPEDQKRAFVWLQSRSEDPIQPDPRWWPPFPQKVVDELNIAGMKHLKIEGPRDRLRALAKQEREAMAKAKAEAKATAPAPAPAPPAPAPSAPAPAPAPTLAPSAPQDLPWELWKEGPMYTFFGNKMGVFERWWDEGRWEAREGDVDYTGDPPDANLMPGTSEGRVWGPMCMPWEDMAEVMEKLEDWKTRQDRGEEWQRRRVEEDEEQ